MPETQKSRTARRTSPAPKTSTDWKQKVPSVSVLTRQLRGHIENSFFDVWVRGEISNLKKPVSGHLYFALKDSTAQLKGVLFRRSATRLKFELEDGMEVLAHGGIGIYEPRGEYQIVCDHIEPLGAGDLQKAYEQLKAKLQKEGLFQPEHKRPLPKLPQTIAIVTSETGAAIRDILSVSARRFRNRNYLLFPTAVQGERAASQIARAIENMNWWSKNRQPIDVAIVGRGGGSLEDLWPFNEEAVARSVFASSVPIISAVGHEIDFSICDFVADLRAATPSAAAELAVAEERQLRELVHAKQARLYHAIRKSLKTQALHLGHLSNRLIDPRAKLLQMREKLAALNDRLFQAVSHCVERLRLRLSKTPVSRLSQLMLQRLRLEQSQFQKLVKALELLSPLNTVARGYSLTQTVDKKLITQTHQVNPGETILSVLADGTIHSEVTKTVKNSPTLSTETALD